MHHTCSLGEPDERNEMARTRTSEYELIGPRVATPQTEQADPTQIKNSAGGFVLGWTTGRVWPGSWCSARSRPTTQPHVT